MDQVNEVVAVGMARSPIGKYMGSLSSLNAVQLAEIVGAEAIKRSGVDASQIEEVTMGMVFKHGLGSNPARQVQIHLGMPETGSAVTVEQQCASSLRAFEIAAQQIMLGKTQSALVIGAESMSNIPYLLLNGRKGLTPVQDTVYDAMYRDSLIDPFIGESINMTAENIAGIYHISRERQDEYAKLSQDRALAAISNGIFKEEIVPVEVKTRKGTTIVDTDENPRQTSMEQLASLRTLFPDGTVTAGNAAAFTDGASAMVIMSARRAAELNITPLFRLLSTTTAGCSPKIMGTGPIHAVPKALDLAGIGIEQIDYFELNEAYAAQALRCIDALNIPMDRINANGSGIALGHPFGMTGLRLLVTGYYELKRRNGRYGCASLCAGGGVAMAAIFEKL